MAWTELFGTDVGLFSLAAILITLGMGIGFARMFVKKMNSEVPATPRPPASAGRSSPPKS
jgi:predicted exporter